MGHPAVHEAAAIACAHPEVGRAAAAGGGEEAGRRADARASCSRSSRARSPSGRSRTTWSSSTRSRTRPPARSRSSSCASSSRSTACPAPDERSARPAGDRAFGVVPEPRWPAHPLPFVPNWHSTQETSMRFTKSLFGASVAAAMALHAGLAFAQAGETVKMAFIDPLSGPFANIGQNILKHVPVRRRARERQEQPGRRQVRDRGLRQQGVAAGEPQRAQGRHRPGHPLRGAGQRLRRGHGDSRRGEQAQRAQSRQGGACSSTTPRSTPTSPTASAASGISATTPTRP